MTRTICLSVILTCFGCTRVVERRVEIPVSRPPCVTEAPPPKLKLEAIHPPQQMGVVTAEGEKLEAVGFIATQESFFRFFGDYVSKLDAWARAAYEHCK